jgi:hypothetical protein
MSDGRHVSARLAVILGLASLASAMGIGRFAFTPIFPLMQEAFGVTLDEGAWLATANYVGYLIGALVCFTLTPNSGTSTRWGLIAVALSTLAMAFTSTSHVWILLRLIAGVASAFVLVGASAWALSHLALSQRSELAGWVFAGVGIGICFAGLVALTAGSYGGGSVSSAPAQAWATLGAIALAIAIGAWGRLYIAPPTSQVQQAIGAARLDRSAWLLVACYGSFGFGYIIPATFIPAVARGLVNDPLVFGWAWPLFGLAAAISTVGVVPLHGPTKDCGRQPSGHGGRCRRPRSAREPLHAGGVGSLRRGNFHGDDDGRGSGSTPNFAWRTYEARIGNDGRVCFGTARRAHHGELEPFCQRHVDLAQRSRCPLIDLRRLCSAAHAAWRDASQSARFPLEEFL